MSEQSYQIEIRKKQGLPDGRAAALVESVGDLGLEGVRSFEVGTLYQLQGTLNRDQLKDLCERLLCDPVAEDALIGENQLPSFEGDLTAKVTYHPGVTDTVAETVTEALRQLNALGVNKVSTGMIYHVFADTELSLDAMKTICERILANPVIQHFEVYDRQGRMILKG